MNNTLTSKESKQFEDLCSLVSGLARSTDITLKLGALDGLGMIGRE